MIINFSAHKVATSLAVTSALCYSIVTLLLMTCGSVVFEWAPALVHLNSFGPMETFVAVDSSVYAKGLIQSAIYTYLYGDIAVTIYNNFVGIR